MANKEKNYGIIFVELFPNGGNPLLEFQPFPPNFLLTFFGLCLGTIVLGIEKTLPYFFLCRRTLSVSSWILKWNIHLLRGDSPSLPLANQNTSQTLNSEHFPQHLKCFILCYWLTNYWIAHSACMSVCVCAARLFQLFQLYHSTFFKIVPVVSFNVCGRCQVFELRWRALHPRGSISPRYCFSITLQPLIDWEKRTLRLTLCT